jgi:transcription initiation factor TFIID TATA-box-binding protein
LGDLGISYDSEEGQPEVQNLICKDRLDREIDLYALVIALGLENVEYEPEQSPFVYYWPADADCLITIPTNGQCIITGVRTLAEAEAAFNNLKDRIEQLFASRDPK